MYLKKINELNTIENKKNSKDYFKNVKLCYKYCITSALKFNCFRYLKNDYRCISDVPLQIINYYFLYY